MIGFWKNMVIACICVAGGAPITSVKKRSIENAASVMVKHKINWRSTLLPLPRITDGITEDRTKTHAKA